MKVVLIFSILFFATLVCVNAQSVEEAEYDSIYAERIKLSMLGNVYIPKDLNDAFNELLQISAKDGIDKFKSAPEEVVSTKLKRGLERWILINWGFVDGSRLSHYLKALGIHHPDDMTNFILITFHRHLNGKPLGEAELIEAYEEARRQEFLDRIEIDTFNMGVDSSKIKG